MDMPEMPIREQIAWKKEELRKLRIELRRANKERRESRERSPAWDTAGLKITQLTARIAAVEEWMRTLPW